MTLTVERLDDGEVSPYLTDELHVGDKLELRGPIGGYARLGRRLWVIRSCWSLVDRALCP
jgi:ferredoxin-NADP reductase